MKISVLVATYKRTELLAGCLQSLAQQQRLPDEVIVIVREEDTETLDFLQSCENQFSPETLVRLVKVTAPGIVNAENAGVCAASGEIVAFIDDDAIALFDWLQRIEPYYSDPQVGAVGGPAVPYINEKPVLEQTSGPCLKKTWYGAHFGNSEKIPDSLREVHVLRGCNMSFRKSLAPLFDCRLKPYWRRFEDDVILAIYHQHYKIMYDPQIQVYHHTAPVQGVKTRDNDQTTIIGSHHNNTYVMLKHTYLLHQIVFLCFTFLIGDRTNPGLVGYLVKGAMQKRIFECLYEFSWAVKGKISGIQTYLEWVRERRNL
ncbi:MAG: glycosyltransferase family 2 protein [SAR324 cluster bacterium]|nr:glycosyltransferase family 2 protein [SAR324 cluster bacterium]